MRVSNQSKGNLTLTSSRSLIVPFYSDLEYSKRLWFGPSTHFSQRLHLHYVFSPPLTIYCVRPSALETIEATPIRPRVSIPDSKIYPIAIYGSTSPPFFPVISFRFLTFTFYPQLATIGRDTNRVTHYFFYFTCILCLKTHVYIT